MGEPSSPHAGLWTRPAPAAIQAAFNYVFHSGIYLAKFKEAAKAGHLYPASIFDATKVGINVPGRSIAWKLFLTSLAPLTADLSTVPPVLLAALKESRAAYVTLLKNKFRAPDGSYEDGIVVPGEQHPPRKATKSIENWERNNPLSLDDENPWREWFAAVELRKTIRQDVERTFPDIQYFRNHDVQALLTTILFLHAVSYPQVGYRQGMHELLAPLVLAIDNDSLDISSGVDDSVLLDVCARTWVAADAWALFEIVMHGAGQWYEWREPPNIGTAPDGQVEIKSFTAPIVTTCNRIHSQHLSKVDPSLWEKINEAGIEPQIYGIRWLRLLFTREFPMEESMVLWDGIFAADPTLSIAPWICVAMLIRIRNKLIPSDYSSQLSYLLRYPPSPTPTVIEAVPVSILLNQALRLRRTPNTSTGASIVLENRNLLNISLEVPEPIIPTRRARSNRGDIPGERPKSTGGVNDRREAPQQSSTATLPEIIARGLLDKSESLGINRAFMGAVSELRRNLSELPTNLVRSPSASSQYSAISLIGDEKLERPPWEPRPRSEIEAELAESRALLKKLGDAVGWAVDVLLQSEGDMEPSKREALECLAYVREVLGREGLGPIEEERLVGEQEALKWKKKQIEEKAAREVASRPLRPPSPPPQALASGNIPDLTRPRTYLSTRDSRPLASIPRTPYSHTSFSSLSNGSSTPPSQESRFLGSVQPSLTSPNTFDFHNSASRDRGPIPSWQQSISSFSNPSNIPPTASSLPRFPPLTVSHPGRSMSSGRSEYPPFSPPPNNQSDASDPLGVLK